MRLMTNFKQRLCNSIHDMHLQVHRQSYSHWKYRRLHWFMFGVQLSTGPSSDCHRFQGHQRIFQVTETDQKQ